MYIDLVPNGELGSRLPKSSDASETHLKAPGVRNFHSPQSVSTSSGAILPIEEKMPADLTWARDILYYNTPFST